MLARHSAANESDIFYSIWSASTLKNIAIAFMK